MTFHEENAGLVRFAGARRSVSTLRI
jgi:hypothetical protein